MAAVIIVLGLVSQSLGQAPGRPEEEPPNLRCGGYCLFIALEALGLAPASYIELEKDLGEPAARGYSMRQLADAATRRGAHVLAVKSSLENLRARSEPFACIALIKESHYVLVYDCDAAIVRVIDFPRQVAAGSDAFRKTWSGHALLISTVPLRAEGLVAAGRRLRAALVPGVGLAVAAGLGLLVRRRLRRGSLRSFSRLTFLAAAWLLVGPTGCVRESLNDETRTAPRGPRAVAVPGPLTIEPPRIHLGVVRLKSLDQQVEVEAILRNLGPNPVSIERIALSCTCTDARVSSKRLAPGSSATLRAKVRLGTRSEARSSRISVFSSDPSVPPAELLVEWQARNPFSTSVGSLNLGPVVPRATSQRTVSLVLGGMRLCESCRIDARFDDRMLAVDLRPREPARIASHGPDEAVAEDVVVADLDIAARPRADAGFLRQTIDLTLECSDTTRARLTLPVSWQVQPPVVVSPARLSLGSLPASTRVSRQIFLRSASAATFSVRSISCDADGLLLAADHESRPDDSHLIRLDIAIPQYDGPWRFRIVFRTDHPQAEEVILPISGIVTSPERL